MLEPDTTPSQVRGTFLALGRSRRERQLAIIGQPKTGVVNVVRGNIRRRGADSWQVRVITRSATARRTERSEPGKPEAAQPLISHVGADLSRRTLHPFLKLGQEGSADPGAPRLLRVTGSGPASLLATQAATVWCEHPASSAASL